AALNPMVDGTHVLDVDAAGVPCERIVPAQGGGAGVLVYLHGGGFALGSLATHRALAARLAAACGMVALSIGYRLAPEPPFAAALVDVLAVYRWMIHSGTAPERIVIAGDSAGGGLAVAALVALRAAGERLPAAAICLSPWVDLEGRGSSLLINAGS